MNTQMINLTTVKLIIHIQQISSTQKNKKPPKEQAFSFLEITQKQALLSRDNKVNNSRSQENGGSKIEKSKPAEGKSSIF